MVVFIFLALFFAYRVYSQQVNQAIWVPVLKKDMSIGQQITSSKDVLELKQIPRGMALGTDIAMTVDDVNGQYVGVSSLYAGLPIPMKALTSKAPDAAPYNLGVGHVAFPLVVSGRLTAASSLIKAGVLIDLYMVKAAQDTNWVIANPAQPPAVPLITKVRVLDVTTAKQGGSPLWILDITPDQAAAMMVLSSGKYDLFALVVNAGSPDLPAIYGKGGETR